MKRYRSHDAISVVLNRKRGYLTSNVCFTGNIDMSNYNQALSAQKLLPPKCCTAIKLATQ